MDLPLPPSPLARALVTQTQTHQLTHKNKITISQARTQGTSLRHHYLFWDFLQRYRLGHLIFNTTVFNEMQPKIKNEAQIDNSARYLRTAAELLLKFNFSAPRFQCIMISAPLICWNGRGLGTLLRPMRGTIESHHGSNYLLSQSSHGTTGCGSLPFSLCLSLSHHSQNKPVQPRQ